VGLFAATGYAPFIGMLMDRFGPRLVLPVGVLLMSAGLGLAPLVRAPWHLHATLGLLVAGGSVFVSYMGHSLFLPNWFVRRRGLAIGLAFSGVGIGSVGILPWAQGLIDRGGWRLACRALGLLVVGALLPVNLLVPRQRPEDLGLRPDGDLAPPGPAAPHADHVVDHAWAATDWTLSRAARTTRFWWVALAYLTGLYAWYAVQVHQTKYLLEVGFAPEQAAWALGWVGLAGVVGQIALGHLSDRVGREWAWTLSGLGYVVCYAALLLLEDRASPWLLSLMVASQGMLGQGLAAVFGAVPLELFQGRHYGTIFGTLNFASNAGAGLGPWMTGLIHDGSGSYRPAFWLALLMSAVSAGAMWLAAPRKVRAVAGRIPRRDRPSAGAPQASSGWTSRRR
jgi:MFS family permease